MIHGDELLQTEYFGGCDFVNRFFSSHNWVMVKGQTKVVVMGDIYRRFGEVVVVSECGR